MLIHGKKTLVCTCVNNENNVCQASITFPIELKVTLGHDHFYGKLFVRPLGIPHTEPRTKFEVFSSSSLGDIDAAMVDMTLNDL